VTALPSLLSAKAVADRYGLRDLHAARKVMRQAGGFVVAGRLMVRVDDLDAYERQQSEVAQRAANQSAPTPRRRAGTVRKPRPEPEELAPGWWRDAGSEVA